MKTAAAIFSALERTDDWRPHLGASVIGHNCERFLWLSFRWATRAKIEGRVARLFRRGELEETQIVSDLANAGLLVRDRNPKTGGQFRVSAHGGHFGGSLDALVSNVPDVDDPRETLVAEFKTMARKGFNDLSKNGCREAQPRHFAQMQAYMHLSFPNNPARQITRALYVVVCKDDDNIHTEIIEYDADFAQSLLDKADRIIFSDELPPRIADDPTWFECSWCPMKTVCHTAQLPEPSCRSCIYVKPEQDGGARWSCQLKDADLDYDAQVEGCEHHAFNPALMTKWGELKNTSDADGWIEYEMPDGRTFKNGFRGRDVFSSSELAAFSPDLIGDPLVNQLRAEFGAVIEPVSHPDEFIDDEIPF